MTDFKFNFDAVEGDEDADMPAWQGCDDPSSTESGPEAKEIAWVATPDPATLQAPSQIRYTFGPLTLVTMTTAAVEEHLLQGQGERCAPVKAIQANSDLLAGEYEGGLKVWECGVDLCAYLSASDRHVQGLTVLDLGCGAGLPGLLSAKMGAAHVTFQDFNREVLEQFTMVNAVLSDVDRATLSFFSGDWAHFADLAHSKGHRYDLILTSDTIYSVGSYSKLVKVFTSLLSDTGAVLVAAKSDYFGVGGGVASFTRCVEATQRFSVEVVHRIDAGIPRKILELRPK